MSEILEEKQDVRIVLQNDKMLIIQNGRKIKTLNVRSFGGLFYSSNNNTTNEIIKSSQDAYKRWHKDYFSIHEHFLRENKTAQAIRIIFKGKSVLIIADKRIVFRFPLIKFQGIFNVRTQLELKKLVS